LLIVDIVQSPREVPSNSVSKTASAAKAGGVMIRSPVRRESAIPVSIGLGEPMLGNSAGPAAYRFSV
jgi:hypothetical protein